MVSLVAVYGVILVASWQTPATDTGISFPDLEWDTSTASKDISITGSVISNTRPDPPPPDTGCRLQAPRYVMASMPLVIQSGQRIMYQANTKLFIKKLSPENMSLFESALIYSVVDVKSCQATGLSVRVATCSDHKDKLCLKVVFENEEFIHIPIGANMVGASVNLHLGILVDSAGKIHVIDVAAVEVITTVEDVVFDKPLWVKMHVDHPNDTDMQGELLSGNSVVHSTELNSLLRSLCN